MAHYLIFGDSIVQGFNDLTGGWVQRLRESLTLDDYVFNLGVSGDTTEGLVQRFEQELKPRLSSEGEPNYVLIAIGSNDSAWNNQLKQKWVPVDKYKNNLMQLIRTARKHTDKVVLISPEPIDQAKVDPIPWDPALSYKTELVKQYNRAMKLVAEAEKLKFVDLFNQLPPEYIKTLDDGVHPDAIGHEMIFNLVKTVLK
jgi:lysophospholipase L1-like esterase